LKQLLESTHEENAQHIPPGKWHCFDLPFVLVCGNIEIAQQIFDYLKPMSAQFKQPLSIALA
jgi:hypothetical protein